MFKPSRDCVVVATYVNYTVIWGKSFKSSATACEHIVCDLTWDGGLPWLPGCERYIVYIPLNGHFNGKWHVYSPYQTPAPGLASVFRLVLSSARVVTARVGSVLHWDTGPVHKLTVSPNSFYPVLESETHPGGKKFQLLPCRVSLTSPVPRRSKSYLLSTWCQHSKDLWVYWKSNLRYQHVHPKPRGLMVGR